MPEEAGDCRVLSRYWRQTPVQLSPIQSSPGEDLAGQSLLPPRTPEHAAAQRSEGTGPGSHSQTRFQPAKLSSAPRALTHPQVVWVQGGPRREGVTARA